MTFIREIVSEIKPVGDREGADRDPVRREGLSEQELEEVVARVVEAVLRRLAERWQE